MIKKSKRISAAVLAFMLGLSTAFTTAPVVNAAEADGSDIAIASEAASQDGFVTAEDGKFRLNGSDFYYAGTNCYYLNFKPSEDVDTLLEEASDMGLSVIRTWGHLDVGTMPTNGETDKDGAPKFIDSVDGGAKEGVYYQYFDADKGEPVVNEGEYGLQKMDYVLAKAKEENVKILLTFTNNWTPFGGMKQYTTWAGLDDKDEFYTNETVKGWFKNYIKTMLNHVNVYTGVAYKDDPNIFAWELANEPRSNDNLAQNGTVYEWAKEMSEYVKSIDDKHMVSVGDEGCLRYDSNNKEDMAMLEDYGVNFNWTNWGGGMGTDFERMLTIDTIDFATPHLYLKDWSFSESDAKAWIRLHGELADEYNKPIILEEFGWKAEDEGVAFASKDELFEVAYDIIEGEGENAYEGVSYDGSNYWMIASHMIADGQIYPDYDGFTVYSCPDTETESVRQKVIAHAEYMNSKGDKNRIDVDEVKADLSNMSDCQITLTLQSDAELSRLSMNGNAMTEGEEYTIQDSKVTFPASYLSTLEEGRYYITFETTAGIWPELLIQVVDSSVTGAQLLTETFSFDKNIKVTKNVQVPISVNDAGELRSVKLCGAGSVRTALTEGTDYTWEDGVLTINASYLTTLAITKAQFELDFAKGEDPMFTIAIDDSTGDELVDDFESYADDSAVAAAWTLNNSGANITRTVVTGKSDSKALALEYNMGDQWWAGVSKSLPNVNWSQFSGVQFFLQPDGTSNRFTVQFRDSENVYWKSEFILEGTEPQIVQIPFSQFNMSSGSPSGEMGDKPICAAELYINRVNDNTKAGTVYIDDFEAYTDGEPDITIVPVTAVKLNSSAEELKVGETFTLISTIEPEDATYQGVRWSSDDETVATVENGVVTAKKAGKATITVTTNSGNYEASCEITVKASVTVGDNDVSGDLFDTTEDGATQDTSDSTSQNPGSTTQGTGDNTSQNPGSTTQGSGDNTSQNPGNTTQGSGDNTSQNPGSTTQGSGDNTSQNPGSTTQGTGDNTSQNPGSTTQGSGGNTSQNPGSTTQGSGDNTSQNPGSTTQGTGDNASQNPGSTTQGAGDNDVNKDNFTTTQSPAGTTQTPGGDGTTTKVAVESVSLNKLVTTITEGDSEQLVETVLPADASNKKVSFRSTQPEVASVDANGLVTAIKAGTTDIIVVTEDGGYYAICNVTVKAKADPVISVTGVTLNTNAMEIAAGNKATLIPSVQPMDATNSNVTWHSSNESVATVDANGVVTAISAGTADIIVTTADGAKTASCKVTVVSATSPEVKVESITLNKTLMTLEQGAKECLITTILPASATNKEVEWSSDIPSIAVVDIYGNVFAVSEGVCTVSAKTKDGSLTATCVVVVSAKTTQSAPTTQTPATTESPATNTPVTTQSPATNAPATTESPISNTSATTQSSPNAQAGVTTQDAAGSETDSILAKPAKVTKVKKKQIKKTSVKLTWKKQANVTGYKIYKYNKKTKKYKLCKTIKKNSATIKKLKKGTSYKFRIKAYRKSGATIIYGSFSNVVKVKTKK